MAHRQLAASIFAALAPFVFTACSEQSPLGSDATSDNVESPTVLARGAVEGTLYQLDVRAAGLGAVLDAYVLMPQVNQRRMASRFSTTVPCREIRRRVRHVSRDRAVGGATAVSGSFSDRQPIHFWDTPRWPMMRPQRPAPRSASVSGIPEGPPSPVNTATRTINPGNTDNPSVTEEPELESGLHHEPTHCRGA